MLCWIGESLLAFAANKLSCGGAHLTRRIFRIAGVAYRGWMGGLLQGRRHLSFAWCTGTMVLEDFINELVIIYHI
jgi:hypothetical protein